MLSVGFGLFDGLSPSCPFVWSFKVESLFNESLGTVFVGNVGLFFSLLVFPKFGFSHPVMRIIAVVNNVNSSFFNCFDLKVLCKSMNNSL